MKDYRRMPKRKNAGFWYRFWCQDEIHDGACYTTRIQALRKTGRWMLGMLPVFVLIMAFVIGLILFIGQCFFFIRGLS